jgi:hypothetical protein
MQVQNFPSNITPQINNGKWMPFNHDTKQWLMVELHPQTDGMIPTNLYRLSGDRFYINRNDVIGYLP